MKTLFHVPQAVLAAVPTVWMNRDRSLSRLSGEVKIAMADVEDARRRWRRFAPLLRELFPALASSDGRIDSPFFRLAHDIERGLSDDPMIRIFVKADSALPVTGSIKARGGVYEVLAHAEDVARDTGLLDGQNGYAGLRSPSATREFGRHKIAVGSTGNLGFSVGLVARALGFQAEVHMSSDAKAWKKDRLRGLGVTVVEHPGDYASAVAAARESARSTPRCYFVDDEDSVRLFLGYAAGAFDLAAQLTESSVTVNETRPLVVYLPCGVGGAPGGLTFGLKGIFGNAVRCVLVEPVQSPCMLLALASKAGAPLSVYDVGLTNTTEADGLAVPVASKLVAQAIGALVDAVVTVDDDSLFVWAYRLWEGQRIKLEPSGAAGFPAAASYMRTLARSGESDMLRAATHVVWTTGGSLLPDREFEAVLSRGRQTAGPTTNGTMP